MFIEYNGRIEYIKHEDIKKDGETVRVWHGGTDSRYPNLIEEENKTKTGDKFIIELGKKIKIQRETSIREWEIDEAYEVKGTGAVIFAKDLENLEKYDDEEIKVGDEIISKCNNKAVVIHIDSWGKWHCLSENGLFTVDNERIYWEKTGKHYDEVEKIFQKLKETEGEIPFL